MDEHGSHNNIVPGGSSTTLQEGEDLTEESSREPVTSHSFCKSAAFNAVLPDHGTSSATRVNHAKHPYSTDNHCLNEPGTLMDESMAEGDLSNVSLSGAGQCVAKEKGEHCYWTSDSLQKSNEDEMEKASLDNCRLVPIFHPVIEGSETAPVKEYIQRVESELKDAENMLGVKAELNSLWTNDKLDFGSPVGKDVDITAMGKCESGLLSGFNKSVGTFPDVPKDTCSKLTKSMKNQSSLHGFPHDLQGERNSVPSTDPNIFSVVLSKTGVINKSAPILPKNKYLGLKLKRVQCYLPDSAGVSTQNKDMTSGGRSADVCKSKPGNLESVLQKTSSDPNNREIQNSNSGTETVQDEMPSGEFDDVAILPSCDQKPQHCKKSENAIYSQSEIPFPENPQAVQPSILLRADDSVKLTLKKAMQNRKRGRKAHNVSYKQPNGPCFKSFKDKDSTNAVDLLVATDDSDVSKSEVTNLMLSLANQEIRLNEEVFNSSSSTIETRLPPQETSQSEPVIKQEQPHDRFEAIEGKALPNDGINLKAVSKKKPKKRRKLVKNVVTLSKKAFSQTPVLLSVEDRTSFSPDIVVEECPSAAAVRDVLASLETSNSKKLQKSTTKKRQQTKEHTLSQIKGDPSEDVPTTSSDPDFKQHQKARCAENLNRRTKCKCFSKNRKLQMSLDLDKIIESVSRGGVEFPTFFSLENDPKPAKKKKTKLNETLTSSFSTKEKFGESVLLNSKSLKNLNLPEVYQNELEPDGSMVQLTKKRHTARKIVKNITVEHAAALSQTEDVKITPSGDCEDKQTRTEVFPENPLKSIADASPQHTKNKRRRKQVFHESVDVSFVKTKGVSFELLEADSGNHHESKTQGVTLEAKSQKQRKKADLGNQMVKEEEHLFDGLRTDIYVKQKKRGRPRKVVKSKTTINISSTKVEESFCSSAQSTVFELAEQKNISEDPFVENDIDSTLLEADNNNHNLEVGYKTQGCEATLKTKSLNAKQKRGRKKVDLMNLTNNEKEDVCDDSRTDITVKEKTKRKRGRPPIKKSKFSLSISPTKFEECFLSSAQSTDLELAEPKKMSEDCFVEKDIDFKLLEGDDNNHNLEVETKRQGCEATLKSQKTKQKRSKNVDTTCGTGSLQTVDLGGQKHIEQAPQKKRGRPSLKKSKTSLSISPTNLKESLNGFKHLMVSELTEREENNSDVPFVKNKNESFELLEAHSSNHLSEGESTQERDAKTINQKPKQKKRKKADILNQVVKEEEQSCDSSRKDVPASSLQATDVGDQKYKRKTRGRPRLNKRKVSLNISPTKLEESLSSFKQETVLELAEQEDNNSDVPFVKNEGELFEMLEAQLTEIESKTQDSDATSNAIHQKAKPKRRKKVDTVSQMVEEIDHVSDASRKQITVCDTSTLQTTDSGDKYQIEAKTLSKRTSLEWIKALSHGSPTKFDESFCSSIQGMDSELAERKYKTSEESFVQRDVDFKLLEVHSSNNHLEVENKAQESEATLSQKAKQKRSKKMDSMNQTLKPQKRRRLTGPKSKAVANITETLTGLKLFLSSKVQDESKTVFDSTTTTRDSSLENTSSSQDPELKRSPRKRGRPKKTKCMLKQAHCSSSVQSSKLSPCHEGSIDTIKAVEIPKEQREVKLLEVDDYEKVPKPLSTESVLEPVKTFSNHDLPPFIPDSTDLSKEYPTKTKGSEQILGNLRLKKRRKRRKRVFTRKSVKAKRNKTENSLSTEFCITDVCSISYPGKDMSFTETTGFSDGARNLTKIGTVRAKHEEVGKKPLTCKYCGISFRHITAYSIHQRIHTGVKPFQCKVCGKTFSQLSQLKSHLNVHKPGTSFPCPCCSQQFLRKEHLLSHFKVHLQESNEPIKRTKNTVKVREKPSSLSSSYSNIYGDMTTVSKHNQEPLSCKDCEKRFLTPANLKAHERTHWPVKPYACSICGKGFNQLKNLRKHSQGHSGQMPFSCLHCGHASSDLSGLRLHQASKSCLARLGEKVSDNVEGFIINQGVDGQVNTSIFFKCQICKQRFSKWCQYTLHLQTHASSPSNICVSCGQCYEKDSDSIHCALCCQISGQDKICGASLSEIMQGVIETYPLNTSSETLPSSVIPQNPQSHTSSELLSKPMAVKTTQSQVQLPNIQLPTQASASRSLELFEIPSSLWKFRCLRCGQRFKQQKSLSLHMQRHPPGFRYTCAHCGQFFDRWSKLWLHQRRHRFKSKYFPCEECNLQFRFLSSFKEHMIGHQTTDACSLAPETFTQVESTNALRSESNAFKKSLKCDVCSKTFSNLNTLITHSLLHNGSTSHFCLSCNLSFANSRVLNEHLKTHSTNFTQALPDIPLKPLDFPYKCKRCNAGFSTGDLLYAHQIRHSQDADTHVRPAALPTSNTSTEVSASTQRNPVSLIKLDGIPNDASLYVYPHPDKLYVPTHVRCPVINLDSDEQQDVSDRLEPSTHLDITHVPQPETTDPSTSKTIPTVQTGEKDLSSKDQTSSTVVDHMETNTNAQTGESFECADCCQKLSSVLNLYEHYILHALGDNYVQAH